MTERKNTDLARRACIAINRAKMEADQALLEQRRKTHGRTVPVMHRLQKLNSRILYLETGGDPFDWRWTV
jgi:hypothetical protein